MAYIGNTPGVSSQRFVQREVIAGSSKAAFVVTTGYSLGYVDVHLNGSQLDESDFTAADGVNVILAQAAAVGDIVRIIAWLPRGLSDGYLKSEADALLLTKAPLASPTFTGLVTTAGQIKFPATQNPSSDANTLDDYEEGTWTPVLESSGNSWTYSAQGGYYVKIGKQVICQFNIIFGSRSGSSANTVFIAGLPFAQASGTSYPAQVCFGYASGPSVALVGGYGYNGQTKAVVSKLSGASLSDAVGTDLASGQLIGQIIYTAA